jgi:hypothetical protein
MVLTLLLLLLPLLQLAVVALPCPADHIVNTIGAFSTALGTAAKCDPWAVEIFAEEVVRGGPAFAVSLVISAIEPTLRQLAELGAWQVRGCCWCGAACALLCLLATASPAENWLQAWECGLTR